MEGLAKYLISITAAAILCGIITSLLGKEGTIAAVGKLLCGLFLTLTMLSPLLGGQMGKWEWFLDDISLDAAAAVREGEESAQAALVASIKAQTEAYILDKAAKLGAEISVEITRIAGTPPLPMAVTISGSVSPDTRAQLERILEEDIGIPKEEQRWTG